MYYVIQRLDNNKYEGDLYEGKNEWVDSLDDAFRYNRAEYVEQQIEFYTLTCGLPLLLVTINDVELPNKQKSVIKMWHVEMVAVATVLLFIFLLSKPTTVNIIGTLAVLLTFGHTQCVDRLGNYVETSIDNKYSIEEKIALSKQTDYYKWIIRYLISKEIMWLFYFILLKSWPALISVGIFLLYPTWRKYYRQKYDN